MGLSVSLFGPTLVVLDGQPVSGFRYDKVRALLAYLAVESDRPHRREALAALLWPDLSEEVAHTNLRQALANLRSTIGDRCADPPLLLISRESVQWNPDGGAWLDVAEFSALLETCRRHAHRHAVHCVPCAQRLARAAGLYHGDFLAQLSLPDTAAFEQWATLRREAFHRQALDALVRLSDHCEARGNYEAAEAHTRRQLELEPWREEAHRQLMRLLAMTDRRGAALQQYERCRSTLSAELGVEPAAETAALYREIRERADGLPPPARRPHNLPAQATAFIGREAQLAEVVELLENPACVLITLIGAGGVGKTRLALQAADEQRECYPDGVHLVALAALDSPQEIAPALAASLRIPISGDREIDAQILNYLRARDLLLVLDNFEQLVDGAVLLQNILTGAPRVTLLVTSRRPLKLPGEWTLEVPGLEYPRSERANDPGTYGALELFAASAGRARAGFVLAPDDRRFVARICRLLEGNALAIELAAAWVRVLSCEEIAEEIARDLDFLSGGLRALPPRHSGLRAVFDHSWELLTAEQQAVFRRLAVFRGGFRREAAERVAGAHTAALAALTDQSLLRRYPGGRYDLHELTRQFALDRLGAAGESRLASERHFDYCLELAEALSDRVESGEPPDVLGPLEEEHENVRAALAWSLEGGQVEAGLRLAVAFYRFWYWKLYFREGAAWLERFLEAVEEKQCPLPARLHARALQAAGVMHFQMSEPARAVARIEASLALWRQLGDRAWEARALNTLGAVAVEQLDYARGREFLEASLALERELGQRRSLALYNLGVLAATCGDHDRAEGILTECLAADREVNNRFYVAQDLSVLGGIALARGDPGRAQALFLESLALRKAMGERGGVTFSLGGLAMVLATRVERPEEVAAAVRLFGFVEAAREALGVPLMATESALLEPAIRRTRTVLGEDAFARLWAEGQVLALEQALEEVERRFPAQPAPGTAPK